MKKTLIKKSQYKGLPLFPGRSPYVKTYLDDAIDVVNTATHGKKSIIACIIDININHTEWEYVLTDNGECMANLLSGIEERIKGFRAGPEGHNFGTNDIPFHVAWRFIYFQDLSSKYQLVLLVDPDAFFALQSIGDPFSTLKEIVTASWAKANNIAFTQALEQINFNRDCVKSFQCNNNGMRMLFPTVGMLCYDRENIDNVYVSMFGTSKLLNGGL